MSSVNDENEQPHSPEAHEEGLQSEMQNTRRQRTLTQKAYEAYVTQVETHNKKLEEKWSNIQTNLSQLIALAKMI